MSRPIVVLKFGGSVLSREEDLADAVHEIYRWIREGNSVVAVVSAIGRTTDKLFAQSQRYGLAPDHASLAALVSTGELTSAALLGLALDRAGVPAEVITPDRLNLRTTGPILDAEPQSVNTETFTCAFDRVRAIVVPGFIGRDANGRTTLLGRGGSDLTALFIGHRIGAARVRLVKDVKGLYERDPARPGPLARIFRRISWDDALKLDGRIIQHKAVNFAKDHGLTFEVGAANSITPTRVGAVDTLLGPTDDDPLPPLRVGLIGLGTVGGGVCRELQRRSDLYEITKCAVRNLRRAADSGAPAYLLTDSIASVVRSGCDVIVEAAGGVESVKAPVEEALRAGISVVTANKALIAACGPQLREIAAGSGARLIFSASTGGAVPMLETVRRIAAERGVARIRAVANGTSNFIHERCRSGVSFDDAVREAQAIGLAEADPSRDLDGLDAADKLALLCAEAWGVALKPCDIEIEPRPSAPRRQVAAAIKTSEGIVARVQFIEPSPGDPFGDLPGESNVIEVIDSSGGVEIIRGKGAGRWPTTEAVLADLLTIARERGHHDTSARQPRLGALA